MKKSIKVRLIALLSVMGVLLVAISAMNVGALKLIDGLNQQISDQMEDYRFGVDYGAIETANQASDNIDEAMRLVNIRVQGTFMFDVALLVVGFIVFVVIKDADIIFPVIFINSKPNEIFHTSRELFL